MSNERLPHDVVDASDACHGSSTATQAGTSLKRSKHVPSPDWFAGQHETSYLDVIAAVKGISHFDRAVGLAWMAEHAHALCNPDPDSTIHFLSKQAMVLEAMALHFARRAVETKSPDHQAKLAKIALASQAQYSRTISLMVELKDKRPIDFAEGNESDRGK